MKGIIMAYWANVENGIVTQVLVVDDSIIDGQNYLANELKLNGVWVQTSYNTRGGKHFDPDGQPDNGIALNMNYAGIGYSWDGIGFAAPQPFPSWTLNKKTYEWNPPVAYPTDGKPYFWNESTKIWILQTTLVTESAPTASA
jgi:hypothetical protein